MFEKNQTNWEISLKMSFNPLKSLQTMYGGIVPHLYDNRNVYNVICVTISIPTLKKNSNQKGIFTPVSLNM